MRAGRPESIVIFNSCLECGALLGVCRCREYVPGFVGLPAGQPAARRACPSARIATFGKEPSQPKEWIRRGEPDTGPPGAITMGTERGGHPDEFAGGLGVRSEALHALLVYSRITNVRRGASGYGSSRGDISPGSERKARGEVGDVRVG